ncbi:Guanine nucleotide exchange C9orf72-like [Homarus americanus]|uniref:Guanine nucleotide exchange C9orf72-like n=1 Tax=Homarus americanus TaxID=6706 RepID=A0A8J5MXT1_HOMAM|nr:Guanine nucleotide exchange C9orf72-like [Homarus americanus]
MAAGLSKEFQVLEMQQPVGDVEDVDSLQGGHRIDSCDVQCKLSGDNPDVHSVPESVSSTPTSGTEYKSCSNPSTPEKQRNLGRKGSVTAQLDATCSVNMSANIANKLNQMRGSGESLDSGSHNSFEEIEVREEFSRLPPDFGSRTTPPPSSSRRVSSQKPSLRQVFPFISCLPFENNIVFCFVLSVWDNIVGPQTVYVWKRKAFPSQRTFDDLYEDNEGIDVGKESTKFGNPVFQQSEARSETHLSTLMKEEYRRGKKKQNKNGSRRSNIASGHLEAKSSIELERLSLSNTGKNLVDSSVKQVIHKETPGSEYEESSSIGSVFPSAAKDQEDTASQEEMSQISSDLEDEISPEDRTVKPVPLITVGQRSTDEPEGQEFGSGWSCGRSRLRIGKVVWYVTVHSVGVGQVGPSSEKIASSLHVVPHQGIIIVAARQVEFSQLSLFSVEEEDGAVPYCLSMVVPLEEYKNFLPLTDTVTTWLVTIAATTRLLTTKYGLEGGGRVKSKLVELCDVLVALRSASLDQYPLTPAGRPPDDRTFAEIILTSHLQTMGCTVVVADSPNAANKGIVRSSSGEVNLSAQKLIQSTHPLTVVDVNWGTVKQTGAPDVHARRNSSALHQELLSLWHDLPDVSAPSESLLEPVRVAAPLVKRFLHDYDRLSSCNNEVRHNFIRAFLRSLQYTALALITWTQHEWSVQRRRSGYGSLRRALGSVFDLDEADLRVVLAQAEILEPGFYSYVTSMSH